LEAVGLLTPLILDETELHPIEYILRAASKTGSYKAKIILMNTSSKGLVCFKDLRINFIIMLRSDPLRGAQKYAVYDGETSVRHTPKMELMFARTLSANAGEAPSAHRQHSHSNAITQSTASRMIGEYN